VMILDLVLELESCSFPDLVSPVPPAHSIGAFRTEARLGLTINSINTNLSCIEILRTEWPENVEESDKLMNTKQDGGRQKLKSLVSLHTYRDLQ